MDLIFGTLVLTTVLVIILNCMIFGSRTQKYVKVDTVEGILKFLRDSKLFPICLEKGWQLLKYEYESRVWRKPPQPASSFTYNLYAASGKIKASAQNAIKFLRDINRLGEWDPGVYSATYLREAPEEVPKSKGSNTNTVQWDVIQEKVPDTSQLWKVWFRKHLHIPIPEDFAVRNKVHYRYWNKEDNGCCWLLKFPQTRRNDWIFYVTQPLEELDHCMLTVVTSDSCDMRSPAQCLATFRHFLFYRKENSAILQTITLPKKDVLQIENGVLPNSKQTIKDGNDNNKQKDKPKEETSPVKKEFTLFKRVKTLIEEKKSKIEEKRRRNSAQSLSSKQAKLEQEKAELSSQAQELIDAGSTQGGKSLENSFEDSPFDDIEADLDRMKTSTPLPSSPEGKTDVPVRRTLQRSQTVSDGVIESSCGRKTRRMQRANTEIDCADKGASLGSMGEIQYKTLSNQCAAEIMAEIIKIGNLQLSDPPEEQAKSTGGWLFYGMDKEVVVLKKVFDLNFPLHCYLGKGLISASPKTVWEAVRNPRTRFTYDESLKKVDVVHDFGNGLKVLYLYHEVNQLFKKESRDFCVLQGERLEGDRSILTMQSIDWVGCPSEDDLSRGQFLASGWIIEPALKDGKICSMVTYLIQVNLGLSKVPNTNIVDEIANRQPGCIALLREYLVPSAKIQENLQRPSPSSPE